MGTDQFLAERSAGRHTRIIHPHRGLVVLLEGTHPELMLIVVTQSWCGDRCDSSGESVEDEPKPETQVKRM